MCTLSLSLTSQALEICSTKIPGVLLKKKVLKSPICSQDKTDQNGRQWSLILKKKYIHRSNYQFISMCVCFMFRKQCTVNGRQQLIVGVPTCIKVIKSLQIKGRMDACAV